LSYRPKETWTIRRDRHGFFAALMRQPGDYSWRSLTTKSIDRAGLLLQRRRCHGDEGLRCHDGCDIPEQPGRYGYIG